MSPVSLVFSFFSFSLAAGGAGVGVLAGASFFVSGFFSSFFAASFAYDRCRLHCVAAFSKTQMLKGRLDPVE